MKQNAPRILLVEPPFYRLFKDTYSLDRYPLSLAYLSGVIQQQTEWDVCVYNADFNPHSETIEVSYLSGVGFDNYLNNLKDPSSLVWEELKSTLLEYQPDVVGISSKSQNFASACIVARFVKEIDEQITVVIGGPYPCMMGAVTLDCPEVDIAVRGEGEKTIVELLNAIETKKGFDGIDGTIYRNGDTVVENAPREFMQDLDSLPFPHEGAPKVLKNYEKYPKEAFRYVFATRGCPSNCFFCGSRQIWSRKVRFRSADNVAKEIEGLLKKGLVSVDFADDTFGVTRQYLNDLCNALITHCPGLKWSCEIHIRLVDHQTISLMKAAGCYSITVGIESGNNEILKKIKKNFTIEKALSACKLIQKYGVELHAQFMVGLPQETEETLNDTVAAMKKINCETISYSIFTPYPGTEAFEFCKQNGLVDDDFDISLYNHQSPLNCFCNNITLDRFRSMVSKIEKKVDRKNRLSRIKRIFSLNILWRIKELGISRSFQKAIRVLIGK